jgi:hypothetical protein
VIHNIWQRGVKGVKVPAANRQALRPRDCVVEGCFFFNDHPKRPEDDPADPPEGDFRGNYVGGIDLMFASGWIIRSNVFVGIRGRTGEGRGAVFLWHESEDCRVEQNVFIDCDAGICLGNSYRPEDVRVHARRCEVRNNFIVRCSEQGILAAHTEGSRIEHNSIFDPDGRLRRGIRVVHANPGLSVRSNLIVGDGRGSLLRIETEERIALESNAEGAFRDFFVDPARGDLHIREAQKPTAPRAARLPGTKIDLDGDARPAETAIGADEPARQDVQYAPNSRPASMKAR